MDNGTTITLLIKQPLQAGGEALAGGEVAATAEAVSGEASSAGVVAAGGEAAADSDHENLFIEDDDEFKNDVNEEDINLRAKRRKYQRQKRRERKSNDPKEVSVGEVGLDLGFEETKIADKSLKGKVDGDEPVYCSSDEYSVDSDLEDGLGKIDSRKVVYDDSAKQDSVGSSILNAEPSDVPSTSRPRGRPRNTPPPPTADAPPRPRERPIKISDNTDAPPRPRGRPRKTTLVAPAGQATPNANIEYIKHVAAAVRGRRRGVEHAAAITRGRGRGVEHAATAARGRGKGVGHVSAAAVAARGRERLRKTPLGDIAVARKTLLREWFENPTSYAPPNPPNSLIYAPLNPSTSPVHNPPNPHASTGKRPKTVGMGVLIAENGFTTFNPGLSSSRILHTGSVHSIRSANIIGDLDYKSKIRVRFYDALECCISDICAVIL
ncbi:hypothetical protein BC332_13001 [Capsicum chinense]|nr:hypothetical protein BC332_13001 [Capsicum chinense]